MAATQCSSCGKRPRGRMASIYWAKFNYGGDREAWKQRWCKDCFDEFFGPWYAKSLEEYMRNVPQHCVYCEKDDYGECSQFHLTAYIPGQDMEREQIDVCKDHVPVFERTIRLGAEALVDRQPLFQNGGKPQGW